MRVAVIGAGAAGLASARHIVDHGIECDVFELAPQLGGTWVYTDEVGTDKYGFPVYSAMYKGLRTNLPKEVMGFPDFPIPEQKKSYLSQAEILNFLNLYADHFNIRPLIKFNHYVENVRPVNGNQWEVIAINKPTKERVIKLYDAVMVCNGHYNEPTIPELPGQENFKGNITHSHQYRSPDAFKGQRVLVIGAGPSGLDLVLHISSVASHVVLSHHSKDPIGFEYPPNVEIKPDVRCIRENGDIEFMDGTCCGFDTILFCTGYKYSFPFLDESCGIIIDENHIQPLYKHMIHIERPTMCFIGIPFNVCAFQMFDLQARFFAKYVSGEMMLPSKEMMQADMEKDMQQRWAKGYTKRQAHMMGPDQQSYYEDLADAANTEPIAPVIVKLRDESVKRLYDDLLNFREDRYKIVDSDTFVKVRKMGAVAGENDAIISISKMANIKRLQEIIHEKMGVEVEKQRLFYKGKQLVENCRVVDYDIQLNDVVLLMIKSLDKKNDDGEEKTLGDAGEENNSYDQAKPGEINDVETENQVRVIDDCLAPCSSTNQSVRAKSHFYKIGDLIDVIDLEYGSWFEAKIVDILRNLQEKDEQTPSKEDLIFRIKMDLDEETDPIDVTFNDIRPRARYTYMTNELQLGLTVLVNYNIEDTLSRGYWYDCKITSLSDNCLKGTVIVGKDRIELKDCKIKFINEVMRIERADYRSEDHATNRNVIAPRKQAYRCKHCKDVLSRKCKHCGCTICARKDKPETILLCDECDQGYHIVCLDPPLSDIPSDPEWYCSSCKTDENEIVKAGESLKFSNKKAKMPSNVNKEQNGRDWGRGMATVGRTKECTIVPKHHYGPVPGVDVGTCWKFRLQVSEAGIHRPPVGGIHGRETDGAYSIVLSGGYEDDLDNGEEFYYTGSGGRNLSGNKRVSEQSSDQTLTRMNKALAMNCNAKFNDLTGAKAEFWRKGKPVRVVRKAKHSDYAPKEGYRYDGVYKVVKYYPEKGKAGYIVWRYLLRRDDQTPAPWSEKGQELDVIYPPGYLEAKAAENEEKKGTKRALADSSNIPPSSSSKKHKSESYKLEENIEKCINEDATNNKLWLECKEYLKEGKQNFLSKVEEVLTCICCQELVYLPVTTECKHNVCQSCLKRMFSSEIYTCPNCRFDLGKDYSLTINKVLRSTLQQLFPGYEVGR